MTDDPQAPNPLNNATTASSRYDRLGIRPTPDSGLRHSVEMPWDESLRPTQSNPPPEVTYSNQGRAIGSHLIDVHDHLRNELRQIRELVDQVEHELIAPAVAIATIDELTIRQNNWTIGAYCAAYCRMVAAHHGLEDAAIFPHLRSCESQLEPVIDRLVEEHHVIHDVLDALDRALIALVSHPGNFTQLRKVTDLLTDTLLSHLSYEEYELVEPLARYGFYPGQLP